MKKRITYGLGILIVVSIAWIAATRFAVSCLLGDLRAYRPKAQERLAAVLKETLSRSGRFGLMLEFDAVTVSAPGGVGPVDPDGVLACTHGIGHDLHTVVLGCRPSPLLRGAGLEVAAPDGLRPRPGLPKATQSPRATGSRSAARPPTVNGAEIAGVEGSYLVSFNACGRFWQLSSCETIVRNCIDRGRVAG